MGRDGSYARAHYTANLTDIIYFTFLSPPVQVSGGKQRSDNSLHQLSRSCSVCHNGLNRKVPLACRSLKSPTIANFLVYLWISGILWSTNVPKIQKSLQNSRRKNGDIKRCRIDSPQILGAETSARFPSVQICASSFGITSSVYQNQQVNMGWATSPRVSAVKCDHTHTPSLCARDLPQHQPWYSHNCSSRNGKMLRAVTQYFIKTRTASLPTHPTMVSQAVQSLKFQVFQTSALDGREWSASEKQHLL